MDVLTDYVFNDTVSKRLNNIFDRRDKDYYNKFARHGIIDPYTTLTGAREYLFFTKPDLNLYSRINSVLISGDRSQTTTQGDPDGTPSAPVGTSDNPVYDYEYTPDKDFKLNPSLENYPFFIEMNQKYRNVAKQLQYSLDTSNPFMTVLSNAVKDTLTLPDISTRQVETSSTVYGTAIEYEADDFSTDEGHSFDLEFEDTKYLDIYMLFKIWHEYTRKKTFGEVEPVNENYRINKILHDQISIFKFIVAEDGETIIHYSKLYGCRPQGVPRSTFSDLNSNLPIKYSISWKAEFVEDMDPMILSDFNAVMRNTRNRANLSTYDFNLGEPTTDWASGAIIERKDLGSNLGDSDYFVYKLKWKE